MSLTTTDLLVCSPDAIDAVAFSWERLSAAMEGDEATVDREVIAPLRDGGWISKDGNRAIELIGWVGDQLQALCRESAAMASILREAAGELRAAQNELRSILDEIRASGMTFGSDGAIHWSTTIDSQQDQMNTRAHAFQARITAALQRATDADALAAETMRKNTDSVKNKLDFNVASIGGDPSADAVRVMEIYTKLQSGQDLTTQEMQQVKPLFQDNKGDAFFQSVLLQRLGPQGMLAVVDKTNDPAHADMGKDDLAYIRNSLREALSGASATLAKDEKWMSELAKAGRTPAPSRGMGVPTTWGYQTLDSLLREGNYDAKFLERTGTDLLAFDRELGNGRGWNITDSAKDPVTGLMIAMKNNPSSATGFFTGVEGQKRISYLAFDRNITNLHAPDSSFGRPHLAPLGEALVAATSGRPTDRAMADVVGNVINTLGVRDAPPVLGASPELRDSVVKMMTYNTESLHLALTQEDGSKDPNVIPNPAPTAEIPRAAMREILSYLTPGEINVLSETELHYGQAGMTMYAAETPGQANPRVGQFATTVGEALGVLDSAVGADIRDSAAAQDASQTATNQRRERWGSTAIQIDAAAAAYGLAKALPGAVPPSAALALGVVAPAINGLIGEIVQSDTPKNVSEAKEQAYNVYLEGQIQLERSMKDWTARNPAYTTADLGGLAGESYKNHVDIDSSR